MISVIVPVYNVKSYLQECLESILRQSYTNFEILLVDDGSTDGSGVICDEYARNDMRIKVFHQSNQGVTAARKRGVLNSQGEFLCFVDSDDEIEFNALEVLFAKMHEGVDAVITGTVHEAIISGDDFVKKLLTNQIDGSLWGRLYKRSLFKDCSALNLGKDFPIGEDCIANLELGLKMKRIVCLTSSIYKYRYNPFSVIHNRKYTLAYEEKFRDAVEKILINRVLDFEEAWYKFQLQTLENLIVHRVKFSYHIYWIRELLQIRKGYTLSIRQRIICLVHNAVLCRYLLAVETRINRRFRSK